MTVYLAWGQLRISNCYTISLRQRPFCPRYFSHTWTHSSRSEWFTSPEDGLTQGLFSWEALAAAGLVVLWECQAGTVHKVEWMGKLSVPTATHQPIHPLAYPCASKTVCYSKWFHYMYLNQPSDLTNINWYKAERYCMRLCADKFVQLGENNKIKVQNYPFNRLPQLQWMRGGGDVIRKL